MSSRSFPLSFSVVLALSALFFSACAPKAQRIADGSNPLASLSAPVPSQLYDLAFWARQERTGTALWRAAAEFCRTRSEDSYPGCRNIRIARWWSDPPPPPSLPKVSLLPPAPPAQTAVPLASARSRRGAR